jgi:hypothetical protein
MQSPKLHQTAGRSLAPATHRRNRGVVLLVAGTLALVLGTLGTVAALAGRSSSASQPQDSSATLARPRMVGAPNPTGGSAGLSTTATVSRATLADGTHPTYIRGVDVRGATITVDVIQVFQDEAAVKAAVEDGKSSSDAEGLYLYIRNQNSLLRTLPVARGVRIQFVDGCEAPPNRHAALTELAKETTPFTSAYYYDITVAHGSINRIRQRLANPAC